MGLPPRGPNEWCNFGDLPQDGFNKTHPYTPPIRRKIIPYVSFWLVLALNQLLELNSNIE